ncbi:MAG: polysaccharide biosynthesis protein [candidate division Zixibacteria bacterium]|nr:polysaccharide biosynthesis protein [candidate division Zixibacteria bacterium]
MLENLRTRMPGWLTLLILDTIVLQVAFFLIFLLRYKSDLLLSGAEGESVQFVSYIVPDILITACWIAVFALFRFYRKEPVQWLFEEVTRVISATSLGMLILIVLLVDFSDPLAELRYPVFMYWGVILILLIANRMYYFRFLIAGRHMSDVEFQRMMTTQRRVFLIFFDLAVIVLSYCGAFLIRFGGEIPRTETNLMANTVFVVIIIRFAMFAYFRVYAGLYRYASINDLIQILKAVTAGSVLLLLPVYFFRIPIFPRSIFVIEWLLLVVLAGGLRFALRAAREVMPSILRPGKRTLIIGAGDAGEMIAREIKSWKELIYQPIGFVDDDPAKKGLRIHGIPVLGDHNELEKIVERKHISQIIIAIPSASSKQMRGILEKCRNTKVSFKTVPPLKDILDGKISMQHVRDIRVDDLLGRTPVNLDEGVIKKFISGRRVLVTGAAGSIGSEICRQTSRFDPDSLLMLDRAENNLYKLEIELKSNFPNVRKSAVIADVCDADKLDKIMLDFQPDVIFHAAAYKQVPLMEFFPEEAVKNNVIGTRTVARAAIKHKVAAFIMISTDKAVRPTSVMGASKRIAEMMVNLLSKDGTTKFVTVRFGNVLGSDGSVVELFTNQIAKGGPVTVTDPRVMRYFMTIREATLLVMMASSIGSDSQLVVLKMGEQVKIVDLAKDMITLAGLTPNEDIQITYIGMRPGEKLHEELFIEDEGMLPSMHPKIMIAQTTGSENDRLLDDIEVLHGLALEMKREEVVDKIREIVPTFTPTRQPLES